VESKETAALAAAAVASAEASNKKSEVTAGPPLGQLFDYGSDSDD